MSSIDNSIRVERAKLKISQSELAIQIEVTRQTIYSIENNKFTPSIELALKLATFFKVKVDEIFWLTNNK